LWYATRDAPFVDGTAIAHPGSKLYCSPSIFETLKSEEAVAYGQKLEFGVADENVFGNSVAVRVLEHFKPFREVVVFHRPSRTLLVGDIAFNMGDKDMKKFTSPMFNLFLWLTDGYNVLSLSKTFRLMLQKSDAVNLAPELESLINSLDFDRVIPCHGGIVETGGKPLLQTGSLRFIRDLAEPKPRGALARGALIGAVCAGIIGLVIVLQKK
jgi:hypothetical protein